MSHSETLNRNTNQLFPKLLHYMILQRLVDTNIISNKKDLISKEAPEVTSAES